MKQAGNSLISNIEFTILSVLKQQKGAEVASEPRSTTEVAEIASLTGIRDREEVFRALYTLEGKSLVKPEPPGDFTSHHWQITDVGMRALTVLNA